MILEDSLIEITLIPSNKKYFQELGYNGELWETILVSPRHLASLSKKNEKRLCDECGQIYEKPHNFHEITFKHWKKDLCYSCLRSEKYKKEKAEKTKRTNLEKYGVEVPMQNHEILEKQHKTMLERYSVEYAVQNNELKQKMEETNLSRYGVKCVLSNCNIQEKAKQTLSKNGNVLSSKQQIEIKNMISQIFPDSQIILNHPLSSLFLDVALITKDIKIDIEYDSNYWHKDRNKDRKRDEYVKSQGYKILRIKSGHLIPSEKELKEKLNELLQTDKIFTQIVLTDWKE